MGDMVPASSRVSPFYPSYHNDDGFKQSNPQAKYQPWTTDNSQTNLTKPPPKEETGLAACKKYLTLELFMSILVGLVICGIPLAVVASLYVQKNIPTSSGSSGSSGSTTDSSVSSGSSSLPYQCSSYTINTDATRHVNNAGCLNCIPDTSTYLSTGWYRFMEGAGTRLVTVAPSMNVCGVNYPGWFNGTLPVTNGTTTTGTLCVNFGGNLCYSPYSVSTVSVTNCNSFYVFYLTPLTVGSARYCTTN